MSLPGPRPGPEHSRYVITHSLCEGHPHYYTEHTARYVALVTPCPQSLISSHSTQPTAPYVCIVCCSVGDTKFRSPV